MKQYLDEQQTTKLIELGFERPFRNEYLHIVEEYGYRVDMERNYSIGELIDFIPDTGSEFMRNRQIFGQGVRFYTDHCIYDFDEEVELIDNLFNLVVRLKEEEVI